METLAMTHKCHKQLKNYLSRGNASLDIVLTCSVIFYIFESLLGDSKCALWHLDRGLILLKDFAHDQLSLSDLYTSNLVTLLQRLNVQVCTFYSHRCPILSLANSEEIRGIVPAVPARFLSISHAESVLVKL